MKTYHEASISTNEHYLELVQMLVPGDSVVCELNPAWFYEGGRWADRLWELLERAPAARQSPREKARRLLAEMPASSARVKDALRLLGRVGDSSDHNVLKGYLRHDDPDAQYEAATALVRLGCKEGISLLIEAIPEQRDDAALKLESHLQVYMGYEENWTLLPTEDRRVYFLRLREKWRNWWKHHEDAARVYPATVIESVRRHFRL